MDEVIGGLPESTLLNGKSHRYIIKKVLGQGSFGITYLAEIIPQDSKVIPGLSLKVAIKEFFMKTINGREGDRVTIGNKSGLFSEYGAKFLREANNLARISHKNIVKVLEAFEQNNTVYYSMEYIDGGNLDDYIRNKGHLSEDEALWVTKEIGSAISHMHSLQILHLDVKPLNIMRKRDGTLKLIDFGLSKQYDENGEPESSTSVGGGTPGYAPIEQASYKDGHGFPVTMDVYALGATLYKMLVGKRPPIASDILNEGFPIQDFSRLGITSQTKKALLSAMQPLKKDRPQTISSFMDMLPKVEQTEREGNTFKYKVENVYETEDQTELELISSKDIPLRNEVLYIGDNMSSIGFSYSNDIYKKNDIKLYRIEITDKRIKASYTKGSGKEFRKSYFVTPENYRRTLAEINSLHLQVKQTPHPPRINGKHLELTVWEDNKLVYDCSNSGNGKLLLEGKTEKLCIIMEKLIKIDKFIVHKESPMMHKVMYVLFKNMFY